MAPRIADHGATLASDFGVELGTMRSEDRLAALLADLVIVFLAVLLRDLPTELGVLGLDPCQLVASGLPLLPGSDFGLGHRVHLLWGLLIVGPVRRAKLIVPRPAGSRDSKFSQRPVDSATCRSSLG